MLNLFRAMGPNYIKCIVDMGFSPPMDSQELSIEDEENSYLNTQVFNGLICVLSDVVLASIMPFWNAHELWTKLQDKYEVSNFIEDDCSPSTSGHNEFSCSSTSLICGKPQTNVMVSSDGFCNLDSELIVDDHLSLSSCNDSSLDLNTHSTINDLHASVDSPCISSKNCLDKSNDDMLALSCSNDKNACVPSNSCMNINPASSKS